MKSNKSMQTLLLKGGELSPSDFTLTEKRIEKLFKDLKHENGCLFLATHNGKANDGNITDKTEFEAWYNEVLINSLFPKKQIMPAFAMQFFAQFNARLQSEFDEKICAIMSEDDGCWTYRFHIVREGGLWISEDLEKFAQPVIYDVF
ncbi:MAG: hypothetical protein K2J77_04890 [Oscillospiraceae bacterium]|nr:hypothetical protein [Oscillospiraceae bacterium]